MKLAIAETIIETFFKSLVLLSLVHFAIAYFNGAWGNFHTINGWLMMAGTSSIQAFLVGWFVLTSAAMPFIILIKFPQLLHTEG